jgi:hypothetical protein
MLQCGQRVAWVEQSVQPRSGAAAGCGGLAARMVRWPMVCRHGSPKVLATRLPILIESADRDNLDAPPGYADFHLESLDILCRGPEKPAQNVPDLPK